MHMSLIPFHLVVDPYNQRPHQHLIDLDFLSSGLDLITKGPKPNKYLGLISSM